MYLTIVKNIHRLREDRSVDCLIKSYGLNRPME